MTDTLKLTPSESVIIRRSEPDVLEVEGVYGPNGDPPPKHLHPAQSESFRVITGRLTTRVDGVERELAQGDTLDIPAGAVHQMWNAGDTEAHVSWETRPRGRTEEWYRAVDRLQTEAGDAAPSPLAFGPVLAEFRDTFELAIAPKPLRGPLTSALAALGRLRGRSA